MRHRIVFGGERMVPATTGPAPIAVTCPRCKAEPGQPCRTKGGRALRETHAARMFSTTPKEA